MKAAQEEAVKYGHWPGKYLVYFVPSCREDLHDGVGEEDEEQSEDAVRRLVRVPKAHRQYYVCKKTVKIWSSKHVYMYSNCTVEQFVLGPFSCGEPKRYSVQNLALAWVVGNQMGYSPSSEYVSQ